MKDALVCIVLVTLVLLASWWLDRRSARSRRALPPPSAGLDRSPDWRVHAQQGRR